MKSYILTKLRSIVCTVDKQDINELKKINI